MSKWNEFKNYMHNDLNVTRDDIQSWIAEAIVQESRRIVSDHIKNIDVNAMFRTEIRAMISKREWDGTDTLKKEFTDRITKEIASKIKMSVL